MQSGRLLVSFKASFVAEGKLAFGEVGVVLFSGFFFAFPPITMLGTLVEFSEVSSSFPPFAWLFLLESEGRAEFPSSV